MLAAVPLGTEVASAQTPATAGYISPGCCGGPAPLGASLQTAMTTQIQNGTAARMVLYHFDFCPGEGVLTPRGRRQVRKFARWLPAVTAPVQIQPTGDEELDEERRASVLEELSALSLSVPEERVLTAFATVRALEGLDAIIIDKKLQRLTSIPQPNSGTTNTTSPQSTTPTR